MMQQPRLERAEQALSTIQYLANLSMWEDVKKVLAEYRAGSSGIQQGGQIQADGLMAGSEEEEEENGGGGGNNPSVPQLTPAGGGPAVPPIGLGPAATVTPNGKSALYYYIVNAPCRSSSNTLYRRRSPPPEPCGPASGTRLAAEPSTRT